MSDPGKSDAETAAQAEAEALGKAKRDEAAWNQLWLEFPTVSQDNQGTWHYWDVPEDTGVYSVDWAVGEALARDTVAHMQAFQSGATVLRRIMREIDFESTVAQGFLTRIEDMLTNPALYLESLEPGAVRAKLRAEAKA